MTEHVRGDGPVELVEFADFQCPYCRDALPSLQRVLARLDGRVRLRFRHFPIERKHPRAVRTAEAAEAAAAQGAFWPMHDLLFAHHKEVEDEDLVRYAGELGLDVARFESDLRSGRMAEPVQADREEGVALGVSGTPAFFIEGERYNGFYDVETLVEALEDAGA
jgi:formate-nitrite transporter family protein